MKLKYINMSGFINRDAHTGTVVISFRIKLNKEDDPDNWGFDDCVDLIRKEHKFDLVDLESLLFGDVRLMRDYVQMIVEGSALATVLKNRN